MRFSPTVNDDLIRIAQLKQAADMVKAEMKNIALIQSINSEIEYRKFCIMSQVDERTQNDGEWKL